MDPKMMQTFCMELADKFYAHLAQFPFLKDAIEQAESLGVNRYMLLGVTMALVMLSLFLTLPGFLGAEEGASGALDKKDFRAFKLIEREELSHDVRRFRFALQSPRQVLGLPIGQHITLRYVDAVTQEEVQRSYTPVTSDDELGYLDFVIKVYKVGTNERFPMGGKMSQHLDGLKIGDSIMMRGPRGELDYQGCGAFSIVHGLGKKQEVKQYKVKRLGMIAGGTGITPMLQVIRAIIKNPADTTEVWLVFCNQTEGDILLRKELEALPKNRFHLWYMLDRPPADWKFGTGFIQEDTLRDHLPPPDAETMIFNCGPPPMVKSAADKLVKLGYQESQFFNF